MNRLIIASLLTHTILILYVHPLNSQQTILTDETTERLQFLDETLDRMPIMEDRSWDGDLGDLNGDGYLDFVISNGNYGYSQIPTIMRINSGDGSFQDSTEGTFPTISERTSNALFLDLDQDGDLDVYVSTYSDAHYILVNNGLGDLARDHMRLPGRGFASGDPAAADVRRDLYPDIVVPDFQRRARLYINTQGYFHGVLLSQFPAGSMSGYSVDFGDVDGDFDLDAVLGSGGHRIVMMINDGRGFFADETELRMPQYERGSFYEAVFLDIDNDGDLDVFSTNVSSGGDRLLINNGSGYFVDESELRLPQHNISRGSAHGDIDNDGDLDLILDTAAHSSHPELNRVWINDGDGIFTDETGARLDPEPSYTKDVLLGDLDNDGDLDLISINIGEYPYGEQNRLFTNLSTPDTIPPTIPRTSQHWDTPDTENPYFVHSMVWDNISVVIGELEVFLRYRSYPDSGMGMVEREFVQKTMLDCGGYLYRETIPAQSVGSRVEYYVKAVDKMGNVTFDPPDAPDSVHSFLVDTSVGKYDNLE